MHQEINSPDISKVYARVLRPTKAQCARFISIFHLSSCMVKFINLR